MGTRKKPTFKQKEESNPYKVGSESLSVSDKLKILDELGRPELIEVFKDWKPRNVRKRHGAPLDQRVTITVTAAEKLFLDDEMKAIKATGEKISTSQYIRNKAMSTVDINGWREIGLAELERLTNIEDHQKDLKKRKKVLSNMMEETDDDEEIVIYEKEVASINKNLRSLIANIEKRPYRLTGRMSMAEAETIRWRAQRLCLPSSDYLRMVIFGLSPASNGDKHLGLDARKRFYVSILDVADNGWGNPPNVYECSQCSNYLEEIERLRDRIQQLEKFV